MVYDLRRSYRAVCTTLNKIKTSDYFRYFDIFAILTWFLLFKFKVWLPCLRSQCNLKLNISHYILMIVSWKYFWGYHLMVTYFLRWDFKLSWMPFYGWTLLLFKFDFYILKLVFILWTATTKQRLQLTSDVRIMNRCTYSEWFWLLSTVICL